MTPSQRLPGALAAVPPPSARIHLPLGLATGSPYVTAAILLILLIVVAAAVHRVRSRGRPPSQPGPSPNAGYGNAYGVPPGYGVEEPPPVTGSGRYGVSPPPQPWDAFAPDPGVSPWGEAPGGPAARPAPAPDPGASPWGEAPGGPAARPAPAPDPGASTWGGAPGARPGSAQGMGAAPWGAAPGGPGTPPAGPPAPGAPASPPPGAPPGAPPTWFMPQADAPEAPYGNPAQPGSRFIPPPHMSGRTEPQAPDPSWDDVPEEPAPRVRPESGGYGRYGRSAASGRSGDNPVDPNYSGPGDWDGGPADGPESP
jgi:hypothetical protein